MCDLHHTSRTGIVIPSVYQRRRVLWAKARPRPAPILLCAGRLSFMAAGVFQSASRSSLFAICARDAPSWNLTAGQTDEGDPWCIVYDREREQVVLHIARINRRYVMARASRPKPITVAILSTAVDAALDDLYRAENDRRTA
jgi:hypothetical protein